MLQVLHHQNQRCRRFAPGHCADDLLRSRQIGTAAAQFGGHGKAQQAMAVQQGKVGVGECSAGIVVLCGFGQRCGNPFQPGGEICC